MLSAPPPAEPISLAAHGRRFPNLCLSSLACLFPVISHQIRNPLACIQSVVEVLIAELDQPGHINDLEAILDEVERLRQLTDRLGLINRPLIDPTVQPVDLAPLAAQALEQVRQRAVLRGIDLDYHGSAEVWAPLCPELILLLLAQLLDNGLDACQAGDAVGLSIDKVDGALTVRIEDSGAGMAPEILQRATEPFFTTKDAHAGMGLTLTREVVERVHGVLTLCSSPNTGTQVVLRLPV